jgi:hypothetical protein
VLPYSGWGILICSAELKGGLLMKQSIKGYWLPDNAEDMESLLISGTAMHKTCRYCKSAFTEANTHSTLGWWETQISGFCEDCFDKLFEDEEE